MNMSEHQCEQCAKATETLVKLRRVTWRKGQSVALCRGCAEYMLSGRDARVWRRVLEKRPSVARVRER